MHIRNLQAVILIAALIACSGAPETPSRAQSTARPTIPRNAPLQPGVRNIPAINGRANLPQTKPPFRTTALATFDEPFALAVLPAGHGLLVTEKAGVLKWRDPSGKITLIAGVPRVERGGQGGLLDVAIAPGFAADHCIYLSFAEPGTGGSALALARAKLDLKAARLDDVAIIWRSGENGPGGQFGANILLAPDGKTLFLTSGERQRFTPAQDPKQALGKIMRLTLDGQPAPDNPMFAKGGAEAATWSTGHRNPYGMAFTPDGRLWEDEMGPRGGDELNLVLSGRNYGWPLVSNGDNYSGQPIPDHPSRPEFEAPKLWWNPSISPTGMIYYSGSRFPELTGSLLITSMSDAGLSQVTTAGEMAKPMAFWDFGMRLRDIAQGAAGEIYLLEDGENAKLVQLEKP